MLDLTGSVHKPSSNVVDMTSPPPAFCLLGSESSSTPACAPPPPFHTELPVSDGLMCGNVHRSFQWPGIDAVMESYQLYLEGNVCHHSPCGVYSMQHVCGSFSKVDPWLGHSSCSLINLVLRSVCT